MTYPPKNGPLFVPGEILVLLSELQDLRPGFYMIQTWQDDWVTLCFVIDDESADRLIPTREIVRIPSSLLSLFMPVGLSLAESN